MDIKKLIMYGLMVLFGLSVVNATVNDSVAYYSFDSVDTTSNTLYDISGNSETSVCLNMSGNLCNTGSNAILEQSSEFDGNNDYVSMPVNSLQTSLGSINVWVNPDTLVNFGNIVTAGNTADNNNNYGLQIKSTGSFAMGGRTLGVSHIVETTTTPLTTGSWQMITLTNDGVNNRLYYNGVLQASSVTIGSDGKWFGDNTLNAQYMGNLARFSQGAIWDGKIDELAIYDKTLSQAEIDRLYNSGVGFNPYYVNLSLTYTSITANNVTLVNDTFYNSSITFETTVLNTSTNGNVNHTYSLNGNTSVQYGTNNLTADTDLNLSEGSYNISFRAFNNETNVSTTNYSFIVDRTAPTIDIIGNLTQNVYVVNFSTIFNVTDTLSGLNSCLLNITYLTANESDSNFEINCTDSQVFTRAGIYEGVVTAIDNAGNTATLTVNGTINPVTSVYFEDENNVSISNYSYTLTSPAGRVVSEVNTSNPIEISPVFNGTADFGIYNITFEKVGYITQTFQLELNQTNAGQNLTFNVNLAKITVNILDRDTGSIVSGPLFRIEFIAAVGLVTNTTTGTKTIQNTFFQAGSYQVVTSSDNYSTEQLFFEFTNQELLTLNVYTTNTSKPAAGVVEIKVVDKFGKSIVGALTQALQWDSNTSSYIKVSEGLTTEDGKALLNIILDTKQYIFKASFGDLSKNTTPQFIPQLLDGKLITISLDLGPTEFEGFLENVNYNIAETFSNNVSNITLDWVTTDGTSIEGCIKYYRVQTSGAKTELSSDCSTGSSNILLVSKELNSSYYIEAQVGFVVDGGFYPQEIFTYQPLFSVSKFLEESNLAYFILPLLYLVVVLIGMANVFIGAVLLLLVNGLGLWLVPQFITPSIVAFFYFVGLLLMMGGSKKR